METRGALGPVTVGTVLLAVATALLIAWPTPTCPVTGTSAACALASEVEVAAFLLLVVGLLVLAGGAIAWWNRRARPPAGGPLEDSAGPVADPGLTYLYQRPPSR